MGWLVSHGRITTLRGSAVGGEIPDRRRSGHPHAGVQNDRVPAGALRRTDRGPGRAFVPGAGARGPRVSTRGVSRVRLAIHDLFGGQRTGRRTWFSDRARLPLPWTATLVRFSALRDDRAGP